MRTAIDGKLGGRVGIFVYFLIYDGEISVILFNDGVEGFVAFGFLQSGTEEGKEEGSLELDLVGVDAV